MQFLKVTKDGGPLSRVWAYWLVEVKRLASVALLRFEDGTRDAFHSHAFDAVSWVLTGELEEQTIDGRVRTYRPSLRPIFTARRCCHRVASRRRTWVLTLRGPWSRTWREVTPDGEVVLAHGRREV